MSQHLRKIHFHWWKTRWTYWAWCSWASSSTRRHLSSPLPKVADIWLVVDMRQPNRAIKRTHHPIPIVDKTFEKFNKCTIFSKIDLNQSTSLKSKHLYSSWVRKGPKGARYNRSKSGWFDETTFQDWFFSMLLPDLKKTTRKKGIDWWQFVLSSEWIRDKRLQW